MNDRFDLHIITHHHSEIYCGYFRRLVFGNSLTFSHIPLCYHAKPPNFPHLFLTPVHIVKFAIGEGGWAICLDLIYDILSLTPCFN